MTLLPSHRQPEVAEKCHRRRQEDDVEFCFTIPLLESEGDDTTASNASRETTSSLPQELIDRFRIDGFAVFPNVISADAVAALNDGLEDVLRGDFDRGRRPDKVPRRIKGPKPQPRAPPEDLISELSISSTAESGVVPTNGKRTSKPKTKSGGMGPIGFSGNLANVKVLQIINIHKANALFRKLETSPALATIVSRLAGWEAFGGARLAQDQVWAKPPGAPPLVFHRDAPYFMFEPSDVVTVWLALDDMDDELGPLEYVVGSHLWGDGRVGSAGQFFQSDTKSLLRSAAEREGIDSRTLEFVSMGGLKRGGLSIHHGKIWHGSAKNSSGDRPRRGLGLHFVPANVRFTASASKSRLWRSYVSSVDDPSKAELSEEDFPLSM